MRLRLEMPQVSAAVEEAKVVTWHCREGDSVAYGDPLVDVVVEEVARLVRRLSAREGRGDKPRARKAEYRKLAGVTVTYRVLSSETGVLQAISAPPGTRAKVGDLLGVLGSADDGNNEPQSVARLVVNLLEPTEEHQT